MEKQENVVYTTGQILKYLRDELTESEEQSFVQWLNEDPSNRELVESFRDTAKVQKEIDFIDSLDVDAEWKGLSDRLFDSKEMFYQSRRFWYYSSAAVLLLSLGISLWSQKNKYTTNNPTTARKNKTVDIQAGGQKAILQLADGSQVELGNNEVHLKEKDGTIIDGEKGVLSYEDKAGHKIAGNIFNTLIIPRGGQYKMILPDGSKVWLNSGSVLKYPVSFSGAERRIELQGEAYFEVAEILNKKDNKKAPFIINFNNTEVEVLGTRFNINSYSPVSKTTLLDGSVRISKGKESELLKPGYQAIASGSAISVAEADTYKAIAWKEGIFYFNEDNLREIMEKVERWYDVKAEWKGDPGNRKFSGTIRMQASLQQVLEMLHLVSGASFELNDRIVEIDFK
ncbi:FecR family protein [Desertivirga xinjiangensis]|uniref:FecR family protein n=1 Tax=Desertivirga xinjiangensis TaxID=539206 RepID=UPI00210CC00E|nr:FecR family protein [Pedobacter xinjiangensis]